MRFHTILLLVAPLLCFAQTPPAPSAPPEVDQALRARVTAFLQFQMDGNFSKAYGLVAEDSKDYYFNAPRPQKTTSFTLDGIQYNGDFSMAAVSATLKHPITLAGQHVEVPEVLISQWKMEKGQWVWYHDPSKDATTTILGTALTGPPPAATGAPATTPIPKDVSEKAALVAAAKITPQATIDKNVVAFTPGKEATEEVKFHNSNMGQVQVSIAVRGGDGSLTVEPKNSLVDAQADLPVKISYKPTTEAPLRATLQFVVEPFGTVYVLPIRVSPPRPAPKQ